MKMAVLQSSLLILKSRKVKQEANTGMLNAGFDFSILIHKTKYIGG